MNNRKVIAIDVDDTVAKLVEGWVKVVNENENEDVQVVTSWDIASHFKCGRKIYKYLTYDLFRNLEVIENSQKVIEELNNKYDVYFTTSAVEFPQSLVAKVEWLEEHFPFIPKKKIVLCGDKSIIKADIMIDDGIHNLKAFDGIGLLFDTPHNKECNDFKRVGSWFEIAE